MARVASPALDELIGQRLAVLDDGFVRVVDYMGGDESVVQAARVSYGKGTKQLREDRGLIRYLMRHRHTTPFEMCEIKLHLRVPMDTWRQWIRHRTANVNEYSTRYSVAIDAAQRTDPAEWRRQSQDNRQGSSTNLDLATGQALSAREAQVQELAREVYQERIGSGVAREQARKDLPLSTYTEAYWKVDLHNLLHFLELRLDLRAQQEIRAYARVLGETVVRAWCPVTWEAFVDYHLQSMSLSRQEIAIVRALLTQPEHATEVAQASGLLKAGDNREPTREGKEVTEKLAVLGFVVPWSRPSGPD
ncbi:MAG TPA: FAD-dependent thymidylate synthase [Vicinamibacteria bacterium]|nr:FAD-dependent thymidylate synthase [Vicinamibacteria bacterium]